MSPVEELKASILKALPGLDCIIGWQKGPDPVRATPLFIRREADVDRLEWGPFCAQNLAVYLPRFRGRKIGVVVKGCDSRSVVELLQENLISREDVTIFSMACHGVVDQDKIRTKIPVDAIAYVFSDNGTISALAGGKEVSLPLETVLADKCSQCDFPNAVLSDVFVGEPVSRPSPTSGKDAKPDELETMNESERMAFWRYQMERCIRCYACRNACPLCVCQDQCVAQSRDPHWLTQEDTTTQKMMFQIMHAMHLAGRCTECGECQRACPMGIPVLLFKKHLNRVVNTLFDYQAGVAPQAVPPLLRFEVEEHNINERDW